MKKDLQASELSLLRRNTHFIDSQNLRISSASSPFATLQYVDSKLPKYSLNHRNPPCLPSTTSKVVTNRENLLFASFLEVYSGVCVQNVRLRNKSLPFAFCMKVFDDLKCFLDGFCLWKSEENLDSGIV